MRSVLLRLLPLKDAVQGQVMPDGILKNTNTSIFLGRPITIGADGQAYCGVLEGIFLSIFPVHSFNTGLNNFKIYKQNNFSLIYFIISKNEFVKHRCPHWQLEWGCLNATNYPTRQPIQTPQVMHDASETILPNRKRVYRQTDGWTG